MNARFASLLLLLGLVAMASGACGSANIKPGGGAAGKGGAGGAPAGACALDSTALDHCTLQ